MKIVKSTKLALVPLLKNTFRARHLKILFLIHLVAIYPIIRSNFNYYDDAFRIYWGFPRWGDWSRFTANFLSYLIYAEAHLSHIAPLSQLLAIGILCVAGLSAISIIKPGQEIRGWDLLAILPLGLSPYFLGCLSYKFDAPHMALSILVSIAPLLCYHLDKRLYGAAVFLGTLMMCTTYQAAAGILPMLVGLSAFRQWLAKEDDKAIGRFMAWSIFGYLLGLVIFYLFIMRPNGGGYVSTKIASFSQLLANYQSYLGLVKTDFKGQWQLATLALSAWFVAVSVYESKQNKFSSFLLALLVTVIMGLLAFGVYPVLEKPLLAPRAMYGVGAFLAFIGTSSVNFSCGRYVARFLSCLISWFFIVFACTYGNALAQQKEYMSFRIAEVIFSLSQLAQFNAEKPKELELVGSIGHAPTLERTMHRNQMLRRLVPTMFNQELFGYYILRDHYGLRDLKYRTMTFELTKAYSGSYADLTLLHTSHYHEIYYFPDDNKFIIKLR